MIGAGPKAVALAAKRHVLARNGFAVPDLAVFDPRDIGAYWSGEHGYTNGTLRLGTPPEKDIGFPYATDDFDNPIKNRQIDREMLDEPGRV